MNLTTGICCWIFFVSFGLFRSKLAVAASATATATATASADSEAFRSHETRCLLAFFLQRCSTNASGLNDSFGGGEIGQSFSDCWRLSNASAAAAADAAKCSADECGFGGKCLRVNSSSSYEIRNIDSPISVFYDDAHTVTVSFPQHFDNSALNILEIKPISIGATSVSGANFEFAGISNQTSLNYRIDDSCKRYEFRRISLLSNGTVAIFKSHTANSNPPDFTIENIRMDKLYLDTKTVVAVAELSWKRPFGYEGHDVERYESYLHTIQCETSTELLNDALTDVRNTENGGSLTLRFPALMVERKCQFRVMVWAVNVCGEKALTEAQLDIALSCKNVEGYPCKASELRPTCFNRVLFSGANFADGSVNVNVSWSPYTKTRPQYYHLHWSRAKIIDLAHPGSSRESESSSGSFELDISQQIEASAEILILEPEFVVDAKIDPNLSSYLLSNLSLNDNYGVQICAIFNGDFKRPEWPKMPTTGLSCWCSKTPCAPDAEVHCLTPESSPVKLASAGERAASNEKPEPELIRIPDVIDPINDLRQTLIRTEVDGCLLQLSWKRPPNLLRDQVLAYNVTVQALLPRDQAPICDDFAYSVDLSLTLHEGNGRVQMFVPISVVQARCEFVVEITSIAINGQISTSLANVLPSHFSDLSTVLPQPTSKLSLTTVGENQTHYDDGCRSRFGCFYNTCTNDGCGCVGNNATSDSDSLCIYDGDVGVFMWQNRSTDNNCRSYDCAIRCNDNNTCLCPDGMQLQSDNKSCVIEDISQLRSDIAHHTVNVDWCLASKRPLSLSSIYRNTIRLSWKLNTTDFDPDANVFIKITPINQQIHREELELDSSSSELIDQFETFSVTLSIGFVDFQMSNTTNVAVQFCITDSNNSRQSIYADVRSRSAPSLLIGTEGTDDAEKLLSSMRTASQTDQRTFQPDWRLMQNYDLSIGDDLETEAESNVKRLIAVAVVIPVSGLIIGVSVAALLWYFYPSSVRRMFPCFARRSNASDVVAGDSTVARPIRSIATAKSIATVASKSESNTLAQC